jgi:hypothetical protein
MESQLLVNFSLGAGFTILGWFARELLTADKELKNDLAQLRAELPKSYVGLIHYREDIRELKGIMDKVFVRLDAKI